MHFLKTFFLLVFCFKSFACPSLENFEALELTTSQKKIFSINHKPTVLIFVSTECPCSKSYEPSFVEAAKSFSDFNFFLVHSNANETHAATYFKKFKGILPVLEDENLLLADRLGALRTPHAFVFSAKGECLYSGAIGTSQIMKKNSTNYLELALNAVRRGKKPDPSETRVLGCNIR